MPRARHCGTSRTILKDALPHKRAAKALGRGARGDFLLSGRAIRSYNSDHDFRERTGNSLVSPEFPRLRWAALMWLGVWVPAYWSAWGWKNFLLLCDIAVILTCIGLWRGSSLLLSSQAVSSLVIDLLWCLDFLMRWLFGTHIIGGTAYMWDPKFPVAARALSFFHFWMPGVLLVSLRRVGYDKRGFALQAGIAIMALVASRVLAPELNLNFAYRDPLFGRSWGPAPAHLALTLAGLIGVIYWATHQVLFRLFPAAAKVKPSAVPTIRD